MVTEDGLWLQQTLVRFRQPATAFSRKDIARLIHRHPRHIKRLRSEILQTNVARKNKRVLRHPLVAVTAFLAAWPHLVDVAAAISLGLPLEALPIDRYGYSKASDKLVAVPAATMQLLVANWRQWQARNNRAKGIEHPRTQSIEILGPRMTYALLALSEGALQPGSINTCACDAGMSPAEIAAGVADVAATIRRNLQSRKGQFLLAALFSRDP